MVVIEARRGPLENRLVFFADRSEAHQIASGIGPVAIVSFLQTEASLSDLPGLRHQAPFRTTWVDLTRGLEQIEASMDRKSCRYEIRRAAKFGERIEITRAAGWKEVEEFLVLYNSFARAHGHTGPMRRKRLEEYLRVSDLRLARLDGKPMCGHLLVRDAATQRVRLVYSATARLSNTESASICGALNRYLHWKEIQEYKACGTRIYDFGGIGDGTTSVARFKLSFGGSILSESNYVCASSLGSLGYRVKTLLNELRLPTGLP